MASKSDRSAPQAGDRVVLLKGNDAFLQTDHAQTLRRALRNEHGEIDVLRFGGSGVDMGEVLDECRSFGLMAPHKLVELDDADEILGIEVYRGMLERYAESPGEGATMLIRRVTKSYPKLEKAVKAAGRVVDCNAPSEHEAITRITDRAKEIHKAKLSRDAAAMLIQRHGTDLGRLDTEVAKMAIAAGEGGRITPDLIDELAAGHRSEDPFRGPMRPALMSGDPAEAVHAVRDVFAHSPRDAAVPAGIAAMYAAKDLHGTIAGDRRASAQRVAAAKALLDLTIRVDVENKSARGDAGRRAEIMAIEFARITRELGRER